MSRHTSSSSVLEQLNVNFLKSYIHQFLLVILLQWKPLNVITDYVIIRLMLSLSKSPVLFVQPSTKKICLL
jgi:hypothetical protein